MATAVEEFLRAYAPVTMARLVKEDVDFHGCPMKEGDWVLLPFPAANRDPEMFAEPDVVRIDRLENRHAAFGLGIHRCLGSNLARMELQVALEEWVRRYPPRLRARRPRRRDVVRRAGARPAHPGRARPQPVGRPRAVRALDQPHPSRLSPDDPHYDEITRVHRTAMERGDDGYIDPVSGLFVFTAAYHVARGTCCDSGCRHCPYVE